MQIGQPVRVRFSSTATDYYTSRVVEQTEQEYWIEIPLHHKQGTSANVAPNSRIWVDYHASNGALCQFQTTYLESTQSPILAWKIQVPGPKDIVREQRREYVRVPTDLAVRLEYLGDAQRRSVDVYARDISGGGLALLLPRDVSLWPGQMVDFKFTLPNGPFPVDVKGVVIRTSDRNDRGYAIGSFQFINIKESVRQRIIQYTFLRQRVMLK